MDMCKDESRQVRITSEKNKNNVVSSNGKARPREITSRYKSGITSTAPRSLSPNAPEVSTTARTTTPKRTQSVERKRPSTPLSPPQRPSTPSTPLSKPTPSLRPSTPSTPLSKPAPSLRPSTPSTPLSKPAPSLRPSTPSTPLSKPAPSLRPSTPPSSTRSTTPSTPSSKPAPSLRPSTPPSSTRSITPVRDSMVERLNSSRRSVASRAPDCLWPSIRSLSSSFQNESSSVLARKSDKPSVRNPSPDCTLKSSSNVISEKKKTPLRGRNASDQSENSKPVENSHARVTDQLRWPGMMGGKVSSNFSIVKSVDLTDKINRSGSLPNSVRGLSPTRKKSSTDVVSKSVQSSSNEAARPVSSGGREKAVHQKSSPRNASPFPSQRAPSIIKQTRNPSPVPTLIRPSSPSVIHPSSPSFIRPSSPSVIHPSSPSFIRPSSPNKILQTSSTRGMLSPSRTRPSTPNSSSSSTSTRFGVSSSVLSYITDVRKGKRSPNHLEDAHQLRLMCNRDLQWRLVNATADAAFSSQKLIVVDTLYNVWNVTSELWDSVILKRIDVENLKQEMKLELIVKEQIAYLEDWSALETDHSSSLSGTIEALKASTVCLPVTGGARADARAVKNAINSAVDAMQAMGSSICYLLSRVQATNCLISELSEVAATESIMLDECRELLASAAAMQVQECSLRTHLIQQ